MTQKTAYDVIEVTDSNFTEVIQNKQPVLVDFWATWCGPCRVIAPIIEELAKEASGQFVVGKLDVDQNPAMSMQYGIRSIPTLIIFREGQEIERLVGGQHTKEMLKNKLIAHST